MPVYSGVWWMLVAAFVLLGAGRGLGVVGGTIVPCSDRRFDAVGVFLTTWPGATCGGAISGTCTLIAPDRVLVARHCLDVGPATPIPGPQLRSWVVRFRRAANGSAANSLWINGDPCHGVYTERRVVRVIDAPLPNNADQVVCVLDQPVIGIRPIVVELNNPPRESRPVILAGWGFDGSCMATGDWGTLRMARGTMPANLALNDFFVFSPCALPGVSPCAVQCPGGSPASVVGNLYDSGAPILIEVPSADPSARQPELRLVATVTSPGSGRRPSAFNNAWRNVTPEYLLRQEVSPRAVVADFNADGVVTIDDVFEFIRAFMQGSCLADLNSAGNASLDNLFAFLNAFFESTITP
jgi:hypothetical protein